LLIIFFLCGLAAGLAPSLFFVWGFNSKRNLDENKTLLFGRQLKLPKTLNPILRTVQEEAELEEDIEEEKRLGEYKRQF